MLNLEGLSHSCCSGSLTRRSGAVAQSSDSVVRVNRSELVEAAHREGILDTAYSFEGGPSDEKYVLELEEGGWCLYFSERGGRVDEVHFDNEHEACDELFMRLVADPTTRRF